MTGQFGLFEPVAAPAVPEGFSYAPDLITEGEEQALVERIAALPFAAFEFRGYQGRRRVVSFGWRYDFNTARLTAAEPMPDFLLSLRQRAGGFGGLQPEDLAQVLVTEYAPGAPIGWHRDRPDFGKVVGVSLLSPCLFRFRRADGERWERVSLTLEPRSAYLLSGPARSEWEHSIPEVDALRYSVTFRTLVR